MNKMIKVVAFLAGSFSVSCFAAGTPVADSSTKVELQNLSGQVAETNTLLKQLVQQNAGKVSEQTAKSCLYAGKEYGQGALVNNDTQICSMQNGEPLLRPAPSKQ